MNKGSRVWRAPVVISYGALSALLDNKIGQHTINESIQLFFLLLKGITLSMFSLHYFIFYLILVCACYICVYQCSSVPDVNANSIRIGIKLERRSRSKVRNRHSLSKVNNKSLCHPAVLPPHFLSIVNDFRYCVFE